MGEVRVYTVRGMSCDHCRMAVERELRALPGVEAVKVDLASGKAEVRFAGAADDEAVRRAVAEAGYEVVQG